MGGSLSQDIDRSVPLDTSWISVEGRIGEAVLHKGMQNPVGANHCFLNVVVQALWHVAAFREALLDSKLPRRHNHNRVDDKCVTCALYRLYILYCTRAAEPLPPDDVREALQRIYEANHMFAKGEMEDAADTFLCICRAIHAEAVEFNTACEEKGVDGHIKGGDSAFEVEKAVCEPLCAAHSAFRLDLLTQQKCRDCGIITHSSNDFDVSYTILVPDVKSAMQRVAAVRPGGINLQEILRELRQSMADNLPITASKPQNNTSLRDESGGYGSRGTCSCKNVGVDRVLLRPPPVFVANVMWPTDAASREDVSDTLFLIAQTLDLNTVFTSVGSDSACDGGGEGRGEGGMRRAGSGAAPRTLYRLRGLACYYGRHYIAFMASEIWKCWLLFDDKTVAVVGDWGRVVQRCIDARYQPVLLFYERMESESSTLHSPTSLSLSTSTSTHSDTHHTATAFVHGARELVARTGGETHSPKWHSDPHKLVPVALVTSTATTHRTPTTHASNTSNTSVSSSASSRDAGTHADALVRTPASFGHKLRPELIALNGVSGETLHVVHSSQGDVPIPERIAAVQYAGFGRADSYAPMYSSPAARHHDSPTKPSSTPAAALSYTVAHKKVVEPSSSGSRRLSAGDTARISGETGLRDAVGGDLLRFSSSSEQDLQKTNAFGIYMLQAEQSDSPGRLPAYGRSYSAQAAPVRSTLETRTPPLSTPASTAVSSISTPTSATSAPSLFSVDFVMPTAVISMLSESRQTTEALFGIKLDTLANGKVAIAHIDHHTNVYADAAKSMGSPAKNALRQLRQGDVMVKLAEHPINSLSDVAPALRSAIVEAFARLPAHEKMLPLSFTFERSSR